MRPYLLDGRNDVAFAFSFRRVCSLYGGPLAQLRRSSDGATLDLFPDRKGFANTSIALGWAGADTLTVAKWYDQSGNARHVSQATTANQPAFNSSLGNSRPGMTFNGSSTNLKSSAFTLAQPWTAGIVFRHIAVPSTKVVYDGLNVNNEGTLFATTTFDNVVFAGGSNFNTDHNASMPVGTRGVVGCTYNGASAICEVNAATISSFTVAGNIGGTTLNGLTVGCRRDLALPCNAEIQEFIGFVGAQDSPTIKARHALVRSSWNF
jgi:hypothetical protein